MRHEVLTTDQAIAFQGLIATPLALVANTSPRYPVSTELPRGAQRDLMNAAIFSSRIRFPINTLTTINAERLIRTGEGGVFSVGHLWDGFRDLLELMRKWTTARGLPWVATWCREVASKQAKQPGEHWHVGHHLPARHRLGLAAQIGRWTGEIFDFDHPLDLSKGEVAFSAHNAWNITKGLRGGGGPEGIGAYLGKAEPNRITLHGKAKPNPDKVRRKNPGGYGPIEGQRYGISREIHRNAQQASGFVGPYLKPRGRPDGVDAENRRNSEDGHQRQAQRV